MMRQRYEDSKKFFTVAPTQGPMRLLLISLLSAVLLFPCFLARADEDAGHNGKVYCPLTFDLHMEYVGTIEDVYVVPGDRVEKGQVLARYLLRDDSIMDISTYLDLNRAIYGYHQSLTDNNVKLYSLEEEYTVSRRLSGAQMGSAERQQSLRKQVEILRKHSEVLSERIAQEEKHFQQRQQTVKRRLGVELDFGEVPEYGIIESTVAGEVLTVHPALRKGMILTTLHSAITLGQTNPMEVRTRVFEADIPHIKVGGKARVIILSLDEREYEGIITSISRSSSDMDVDRPSYYAVRLDIPNDNGELRAGFKAVVHFVKDSNVQ
ncbi:HlyD family efflux transporter periplasmic adaptor subunit [Desulfovibrio sp. OttesenSCG-928-M14]|nr:HlyD family efflux transporter periplasmic adaptor subunit [Desulfovibrio sp. OttesenSCG-928-M14]